MYPVYVCERIIFGTNEHLVGALMIPNKADDGIDLVPRRDDGVRSTHFQVAVPIRQIYYHILMYDRKHRVYVFRFEHLFNVGGMVMCNSGHIWVNHTYKPLFKMYPTEDVIGSKAKMFQTQQLMQFTI